MPEPDLHAFSAQDAEDVYQLITQLPTGYRTVFNLFVVEGYSHAEIASMLEINETTSRSQLFKAKALLKKMLTQEGYHYGT
jgi:RNA polymerase sigma-70 factor (ECF subfamily)